MVSSKVYLTLLTGLFYVYPALAEEPEKCSTTDAEPCLASRQKNYAKVMESHFGGNANTNGQFEEMGAQMCLTQIRNDQDGNCFETNTELCALDRARDIKAHWNALNRNITAMCKEVCPNFLQIVVCKNLTYTKELKDNRFERFCRSFNESLMCALNALVDCEFGVSIYYSALEQQIMPYWNQICNSGCINIDETVGIINKCSEPLMKLDKPSKTDLCKVHYNFKKCVFDPRNNICEQVMDLIKFMYRQYHKVDRYCITTTSTTTTSTTTASTTTDATTSSTITTPLVINYTIAIDTATPQTDADTSLAYSCISNKSIAKISTNDQLTVSKALDLMQLESCIFTNLSVIYPTFTPTVSLYHIPPALRELFKSYKENGHQLLRESMTKMARCDSEKENGCSGHSYGLIVCESSGSISHAVDWLMFSSVNLLTGLSTFYIYR